EISWKSGDAGKGRRPSIRNHRHRQRCCAKRESPNSADCRLHQRLIAMKREKRQERCVSRTRCVPAEPLQHLCATQEASSATSCIIAFLHSSYSSHASSQTHSGRACRRPSFVRE
ncbi:hypothetical protein HN011_006760, partial [Eciton burchellii]